MNRLLLLPPLSLAIVLAGCGTTRPLYYWGNYEPLAYQCYRNPEKATPAEQVAKLQEDLAKAAAKHLSPNPGLHLQLGVALFQLGRYDEAAAEFAAEKGLFPESAALVDHLLEKLKGAPTK